MYCKSTPKWPKNILKNNISYHSTVVQLQFITPSIFKSKNTKRKNFKIIAQNLKRCINEEQGLSGHLESRICMIKVNISGIKTM